MITINDLTFSYKPSEDLFHKLKLHLNAGVICGLLGKNGAGKTTLLRLIAGLLFPQKGECHVLNHEPRQRFPQFLQEIYFLPEEFYVPAITAQTYIDLFSPFYTKFNQQDFLRFAHEFDLPLDKRLNVLSYGQKKKFLVAFGLATNCSLLLFDEPTNGLDIPSKSQFRKLLAANLNDEKTVIISTHQVRDLQNLLDTIVILDDGEIVFNNSLLEVSKKISFIQKPILTPKDEEESLYAEKTLGGYILMQKAGNEENQELEVDLEILFNALMLHRKKVNSLF